MCQWTTRQSGTRSDGNVYDPSKYGVSARSFDPYHRECKGNDLESDRFKLIMKGDANVVLFLEPGEIDNFLDYGMSIWITSALPEVEIL